MQYLYLGILSLLLVISFEFFAVPLTQGALSIETLIIVNATLYVLTGTLFLAHVAQIKSKKFKSEQRLIIYLVILAVVALKVISAISTISW